MGRQEEEDDDDDDDEDDGLPPGTISIDTNPTPVAAPTTPPPQHWDGGSDGIDRLLVCAPSNRGVQEVLERLLTAVDKPIDEEDENGSANALELTADDLILIGDGDKILEGTLSSSVFVHRIEEQWRAALQDGAKRLKALCKRLGGEGEKDDDEEEALMGSRFFARAELSSLVQSIREQSVHGCTAEQAEVLATLQIVASSMKRVCRSIRARMVGLLDGLHDDDSEEEGEVEEAMAFVKRSLRGTMGYAEATMRSAIDSTKVECDGLRPSSSGDGCVQRAAASLEALCKALDELKRNTTVDDRVSEMLSNAKCVFCTLVVAGCYAVRGMPAIDALIVDEAAQATEPEVLIPLCLHPRFLLLCGDPNQLGCVCMSRRAKEAGLERSMMARLMASKSYTDFFFLETQYRMHPSIAAFPSERFYEGRLVTDTSCALRPRLGDGGGGSSAWLGPWAFVNVVGGREERGGDGSVYNRLEAEAVLTAIKALRSSGVLHDETSSTVRVLTFYAAQVRCIKDALRESGMPRVSVGTVDGAQGAESDIIILSFVRCNRNGSIGFVNEWRRLNVAITRAKRCLLMFGDASTIGAGDLGEAAADLVRHAAKVGSLCTYDPNGGIGPVLAPELGAEIVSGAQLTAKRRRAPAVDADEAASSSSSATVTSSSKARKSADGGGGAEERILPLRNRQGYTKAAPSATGEDYDEAFLKERAAEIESYVAACKEVDAAKVERRAEVEREARRAVQAAAGVPGRHRLEFSFLGRD